MQYQELVEKLENTLAVLKADPEKFSDRYFSSPHVMVACGLDEVADMVKGTGAWDRVDGEEITKLEHRGSLLWTGWPRTDVCERIPTGRKVKVQRPAGYVEVEEDEYKWECRPILSPAG